MPNGDCPVGSANKARIEGLEAKQVTQDAAIEKVADKLDRINWWLVALLGGMVVSLALQIANGVTKG
jgi:hypothetical protein